MSTLHTQPAVTQPYDEEAERLVVDDQDTVAETRPLPETEPVEARRGRPELLPTIGHIGRYALKYVIGEGGLGTVYAAHDPLLARLIAIKTLHVDLPASDREQFNALFLNEAKAAGSLNHANIVTVYDVGSSEQGTYIAMEMLRGKDLRQLLAMGWKPTPAQAALIVRRVADALNYAHHKGVIHRDIKPANIFMVGRTQPRVLDFGIARIRQAETLAQRDDPQSRFQEIVGGSPYYMAPEQVLHKPVDRRVDVYALGVVLYELLVYKRAFGGNSLEDIADAVLNRPVPLPHELNPEVPQALSEIVARAMHRDPEQRTRSARRLSAELRDWLDSVEGDQGRVPPPVAAPRGGAAQAQKLGLLALAVGGALLALASAGWYAWQVRGAARPTDVAADGAGATAAAPPAKAALGQAPAVQGVQAAASVAAPGLLASVPGQAVAAAPEAAMPVPMEPGALKLAIDPWGEVWVDGRAAGLTPPLREIPLPPGRHAIEIRNGDLPAYRLRVDVQPGKSVQIRHQF